MYTPGLVSIVTPCYNSETFIHRLLKSVLIQDYPAIEMFAIDDGSTDDTGDVIKSYIPIFQSKGYKLTYLYQENAGQASAVNRGLKLVSGEFLTWPDSDDYYITAHAISIFVSKFRQLDETYGAVCSIGSVINEKTLSVLYKHHEKNHDEILFYNCLLGKNFLWVPINYMVRLSAFESVNPARDIYVGRHPQNIQMFLPLFHSYKCYMTKNPVCKIVVRRDSHSHKRKPYEGQLNDIESYDDIYTNTLNRMHYLSNKERNEYLYLVNLRILNDKISLALSFARYDDARMFAKRYHNIGGNLNWGREVKLFLSWCPPILRMAEKFQKECQKYRRMIQKKG